MIASSITAQHINRLGSAGAPDDVAHFHGFSWRPSPASQHAVQTRRHASRGSKPDDFWSPPAPSLPDLIFQAAETDEDSKRQETLATVMRRLPDASLEVSSRAFWLSQQCPSQHISESW